MFKLRARKRTLGSLLAIGVLALAAVLVSPTTPTAQAAIDCPIGSPQAPIDGYERIYSGPGVTMCHGLDGAYVAAQVQIVDIAAGARLEFKSDPAIQAPNPADNQFPRKDIDEWGAIVGAPGQSSVFSVTNASFFTSTTTTNTKLSLPFKTYLAKSHGTAIYNQDPNGTTPKRLLRYHYSPTGYRLQIEYFPTIYTAADAECSGWNYCLAGFVASSDVSGDPTTRNNRTFVGLNSHEGQDASRAFILTGGGHDPLGGGFTVAEAQGILLDFGANSFIQLDGGGSTQMVSYAGSRLSLLDRHIPNVLVVEYDQS